MWPAWGWALLGGPEQNAYGFCTRENGVFGVKLCKGAVLPHRALSSSFLAGDKPIFFNLGTWSQHVQFGIPLLQDEGREHVEPA